MTFLGNDRLATYSSLDNHLLVTDLQSGAILYNQKRPTQAECIVEGITSAASYKATGGNNLLGLLTLDSVNNRYEVRVVETEKGEEKVLIGGLELKKDSSSSE